MLLLFSCFAEARHEGLVIDCRRNDRARLNPLRAISVLMGQVSLRENVLTLSKWWSDVTI
jgi:hypothetical protein